MRTKIKKIPKKIPKKATKNTLKKETWKAFSRYIRLRDCLRTTRTKTHGKCITCGQVFPFNRLQAGHFIAGRGNSVLFDEMGVNAQCVRCNMFKGGEVLIYRQVLVERHGEKMVEELEMKRHVPLKRSEVDLMLLKKHYEDRYDRMMSNGGRHE